MNERVERIRQLWGAANPDEHRAPQLIRDVQTLLTALAQAEREREKLAKDLARVREALEWYAERAQSLNRYMAARPPKVDATTAVVTELALDNGVRAALTEPTPPAGGQG